MELVVDANVILSALIADSKTRELLVTIDPTLLAPETILDEIDRYRPLVVERSGQDEDRVDRIAGLLLGFIEVVPVVQFREPIETAEHSIGAIVPDDVLYLACAISRDATMWSDDGDLDEQDLVSAYSTTDVVAEFDD